MADEQQVHGPSGFVPIDAPIVRVELFQDRAAVHRQIHLGETGRHRVRIGPVSELVDVRRIAFPQLHGVVVEEVQVRIESEPAPPEDTAEVERLEAELREVRAQREAQADAVRRAREANLRARESSTAAQAATVRALQEQDEVVGWAKAIQSLAEHQGATLRAVADAELRLAQLTEQETDCARALDQLRTGAPPEDPQSTNEVVASPAPAPRACEGWIELSLLVEEPTDQIVRYVVPCAVWRPSHQAVLSTQGEAPEVQWHTQVVCWNRTGEDWQGVEVVCSTARDARRPGAAEPVSVGVNGVPAPAGGSDPVALHELTDAPLVEAQDVPAVDDGGTPQQFELGRVELPSDGSRRSFTVQRWSAPAELTYASVPEHSPHVVLRSTQPCQAGGPLLAGPVDLVRDGRWIGRAAVALCAADAPFSVDWGSVSGLSVDRRRETEIERQKPTDTLVRTFRVSAVVRNTTDAPRTVKLRERIPISAYSDVFVSEPVTEPPAPVDADGFCAWELELAPGAHQRLSLSYAVRSAADADLPFKGP